MRKLTGLIASAAVLAPAAALAQTATPPTPWEDVPPAALNTPGQPLPSTVPAPAPAAPPGVSWHRSPAAPPPPVPAPGIVRVHRDGPATTHVEVHEAPPPAYGGSWEEVVEARVQADPHFDYESCRALPGHRYECGGQGAGYGYAYPYGYVYPGYGYGGTVTITETTVTTGPGVTVRTYQDEAETPQLARRDERR